MNRSRADSAPFALPEVVQVLGHTALGGAVPVVVHICRICEEVGLQPVVLATHPAVVSYLKREGCEVWEFPGLVREPNPFRDLWVALSLAVQLRRRGTKVVHTHTSKGGMVGRLAGRLAGCDLVIHHTHGFYHTGLRPGITRLVMMGLEWVFSHLCDFQLFVNAEDREEAVSQGFLPQSRALTIFNGVDDPLANERLDCPAVRESWGIPRGHRVLGIVTRIAERKGVDICLRAFERLRRHMDDLWLIIIGEGPGLAAMQHLALELGVSDRSVFLGFLPEAGRYYECFDLAVTASEHEGQSISVIEAIACGTPVIASDIRGHRDMVLGGRTGLLCPVGDAEAFAAAVEELLESESRRAVMAVKARAHFEQHFTMERFREEVRSFYIDALSQKRIKGGLSE